MALSFKAKVRSTENMILGITGGVGCGKSTVLDYLASEYGAFLIECDDVARDLQQPGGVCYQPMIDLFGSSVVSPEDGSLDRQEIARRIFKAPALRQELNGIVHPAVKRRVKELIRSHSGYSLIVIEAALLLDDNYGEICDEIWYIHTDDKVRRERLKISRGYSDQKIDEMFASQRSEESFRSGCALSIDNSSENIQNTFRQLDEALLVRGIRAVHQY